MFRHSYIVRYKLSKTFWMNFQTQHLAIFPIFRSIVWTQMSLIQKETRLLQQIQPQADVFAEKGPEEFCVAHV